MLQPDGQLLVTGGFHTVNGVPMHNIARLNNDWIRQTFRLDVARQTRRGEIELTLTGEPGVRLILEASRDLRTWTTLGEATTGPEPIPFLDSAAGQFPLRFYRARTGQNNLGAR